MDVYLHKKGILRSFIASAMKSPDQDLHLKPQASFLYQHAIDSIFWLCIIGLYSIIYSESQNVLYFGVKCNSKVLVGFFNMKASEL